MRKKLLCGISAAMTLVPGLLYGQKIVLPADWQNLDLKKNGVFGIGIDKAYEQLQKGKKARTVIVAVIDGGLDISQEDLQGVIWTNPREIPGNGRDDDHNGYVDDIHGWNFLGSAHDDYEYDNDDLVIEIRRGLARFGNRDSTALSPVELRDYRQYLLNRKALQARLDEAGKDISHMNQLMADIDSILRKMGKTEPTVNDFEQFVPTDPTLENTRKLILSELKKNPDFKGYMDHAKHLLEEREHDVQYLLNINYDPRARYAADYAPERGRFYGNPHVSGAVPPEHGTHVAGIIGALRHNGIGINGVADHVLIMPVRAIPDGGGRDIDEANAIRYAAENGAKVINMSFGLSTANDRVAVEAAVKYAASKDVLFIQAAGNGGDNLDLSHGYPDRSAGNTGILRYFIKVGASGAQDDDRLLPHYSNYGKIAVDVFAPGVNINSTMPGNRYEVHSGTSMAAPVVAGLAAVIREYYPKLTAIQVKEIILRSVTKRDILIDKCVSGGVVNACGALKLAATYPVNK
ncbi:S8 family serine peptidase [Mucilaginibacter sp. UR6-11]|uniref:S8 family serine peptidase n=1 Tax=Mucilaginibacter sp. UR6-11 TaxID=1435644 RepID=UPI001E553050|nr:S8 family serine peptidase [Mucilaginibacter sp. UR6-11]MCC8423602.1 S8 family serine peptidase [Mucilaginibacter sp. UR6-11]